MPTPRPTVHQTTDYPLRRVQDYIAATFARLSTAVPFLSGALLDPIAFDGVNPVVVPHTLDRLARGFIVVDCTFGLAGNLTRDTTASNDRTIKLSSTTPCTVTLWVW